MMPANFDIAAATPAEWPAALELMLQDVDRPVRAVRVANLLTLLTSGELEPAGIFVARSGDLITGVQVTTPRPGAWGLLWPPRFRWGWANHRLEDALLQTGLAFLRERGCRVVQAILKQEDQPHVAPLARAGMMHVTDLLYLRHDLADVPAAAPPTWQLETYRDANCQLFHATLLRTYEQTLDCPELNGRRTIDEIMAGHRAQGLFQPARWQLASCAGEALGILMLTELPDEPAWDLSYLGVIPERRRQGWGRALALWALNAACQGHALELQVAVDRRNAPALQLYQLLGFRVDGRRSVWLHA